MDSLSFGRKVLNFWGLKEDTLTSLPLQFERPVDYKILIKTETINSMRDLEKQIQTSSLSLPIIVQGNRGSGKSTAMRYLYKLLVGNPSAKADTLAIYVRNMNLDDTNFKTIKQSVHSDFLAGLVSVLPTVRKDKGAFLEHGSALGAIEKKDINLIDNAIMSIFKSISQTYRRTVIFVDNMDKSDPNIYKSYEEYFRKDQGFYELLLSRLSFVFIAMQRFMAARFRRNMHVNYLMGGKSVSIGPWSDENLDELLSVRLRLGAGYDENSPFHISEYFDKKALDTIYSLNDFNPRWTILGVKQLMDKAARLNEDPNNRLPLKPIRRIFVNANIEEAKGAKGFPEFKKFDLIDAIVIRQHSKASEMINNCMKKNEAYAWDIVYTLLGIWRKRTTDDIAMANILQKYNLISKIGKNRYETNNLVKNLLDYLYRSFEQDLDSVRYYFIRTPP